MERQAVLITGCSTGIGFMAATQLNQAGYHVIASCRKTEDVERIRALGIECLHIDLADEESINQGVQDCLSLCNNKLYAVVNNGAFGLPGAIEDLPTQALRFQFDTNLFGWHHLTTQLIPHFREQGHGRIILVSSVLGFAAMKYRGAYNTSKFALEGWADTLRLELRDSNISVSLLQPGPIETQFRANALAQFIHWIDQKHSVHAEEYQLQLKRLSNVKSGNQFCLPPEACLAPLKHALNAKKPKARYPITTPTKLFAVLKRILPQRALDAILAKSA